LQIGGGQSRNLAEIADFLDAVRVAVNSGALLFSVVFTVAVAIPAGALGIFLSRRLCPRPQRTPEQAATIKRAKRFLLLYCTGLLALAGLIWFLSGNLPAGIGITLPIMVALQFIVSGVVTRKKAQINRTRSERPT
jgi:hypothetical protein